MLKKELETAKELATKAGNILLERYQEMHDRIVEITKPIDCSLRLTQSH